MTRSGPSVGRRGDAGQFAYRALRHALRWTGGWCDLQIHKVVAVPLRDLLAPARPARNLQLRWLTPADQDVLLRLRPAAGAGYAERFTLAHRCIGAFLASGQGAELVAFCWLLRGPAKLPSSFGCVWDVPPSMVWVYDLYSDPSRIGMAPHLYAFLRTHPPGPGVRWAVGQNDFVNLRSRSSHQSLGFRNHATLWSLRLGAWRHFGWGGGVRTWYGNNTAIALARLVNDFTPDACATAEEARAPAGGPCRESQPAPQATLGSDQGKKWRATAATEPATGEEVQLLCACGEGVGLAASEFTCRHCGRVLGRWDHGLARVAPPAPYWGELDAAGMGRLLQRSLATGWRQAVNEAFEDGRREYVQAPSRAAFHELLPLPPGSRILDVGAGWGSIAAPLAAQYNVVALEGVEERARFIALRKQQDSLTCLTVLCGDLHRTRLAPDQFDGIIANGVLEWSALGDLSEAPRRVQVRFLRQLRAWLRPRGYLYLGVENRAGWAMLRGGTDHSGRRFTSLLPRFAAQWACRGTNFRAANNVGYRTYTYTYPGYVRLFAEAGLRIETAWVSPGGYNDPVKLIPLHTGAIQFAARHKHDGWPRDWLRAASRRAWIWRLLGSDFVFLLRPAAAAGAQTAPATETQVQAHA